LVAVQLHNPFFVRGIGLCRSAQPGPHGRGTGQVRRHPRGNMASTCQGASQWVRPSLARHPVQQLVSASLLFPSEMVFTTAASSFFTNSSPLWGTHTGYSVGSHHHGTKHNVTNMSPSKCFVRTITISRKLPWLGSSLSCRTVIGSSPIWNHQPVNGFRSSPCKDLRHHWVQRECSSTGAAPGKHIA
jgi:hypothetical protein